MAKSDDNVHVEGLEIGGLKDGEVRVGGHLIIHGDSDGEPPKAPKAPAPPKAPKAPRR